MQCNIPNGWKVYKLGDLFEFIKGKIPKSLDKNISEQCNSLYLTIDAVNDGEELYCSSLNMPYCMGDVLMVMDGAASGDVYVGYNGVVGSTFCMLKPKAHISSNFLYQILYRYAPVYKKTNVGSTVPHANKNYIESMLIALPDKIEETFDIVRLKINNEKALIKELRRKKEYLLPLLMNGQIAVQ